ncbi:MAG TPA: response regulator transcription factor, partial [Prochlorococcus sp.]
MTDASPPKTRILLVDDEPRLTELLRLELDVEGYEVSVAENGASGLIKARSEPPPNLIILDWNLPDFTGVDVCQRIRSSGIKTPILMLTGNDDVTDRVKALDAGVDDYLTKPFSIEELMARLRAMQRRAEKFSGETDVEQIP